MSNTLTPPPAGQPPQGQPYPGPQYPGQPAQGQPYQGQQYPGRPYQGQPYPPQGPPPQQPPTRSSGGAGRVIAILLIVFGAIVVLGAITSAVISTAAAASVHTSSQTADVTGVSSLDIDVSAGSLDIEFADIDEAELEVTSSWGADRWTLRTDGSELTVSSDDDSFWGTWWWWGGPGDGVLRLPSSLEGSDANFSMSAGELVADGTFGAVDVDLSAGRVILSGTADDLVAEVSAGGGDIDFEGVATANLSVSAGELDVTLSGSQPDSIEGDVSAGTLRVTVPRGDYDISSNVSAGSFDNSVRSTSGADSTIRIDVSAGKAVLEAR